jgi:hypothetical protein
MSDESKISRAWSVGEVLAYKPHTLEFEGAWLDSLGTPERRGSILIYGMPKNGKTDFSLQLAKYLTNFGRVLYNSREEGLSASMKEAVIRHHLIGVQERFHLVCEGLPELKSRLEKRRSADFVFIDSVQRLYMKPSEYTALKEQFPGKLFIFISHVDGSRNPEGRTAMNIKRYSDIFVFVDGFVASPTCRIGGGERFVIWQERAMMLGTI